MKAEELKDRMQVRLPEFPDRQWDIRTFGAKEHAAAVEDSICTARAINQAIEAAHEAGGGTVLVPAGIWITGPVTLLGNVRLYLEKGALLKFSKNMEEYPLILTNYEGQECIRTVSPIHAQEQDNIAIAGDGVIDGSGDLWRPVKQFKLTERQWEKLLTKSSFVVKTKEGGIWLPTESAFLGNEKNIQKGAPEALKKAEAYYDFYRPVMISLEHCRRVLIEGVTLMNSPAWNVHPFFCEDLTVRHAAIRNPYYAQNGDGIDVESCRNVHIHDMNFETGDDAICLKSGKNAEARTFTGPCEQVYIHDCVVQEGHGGFVIGSEMSRGVRHVLVENCTFMGTDVGLRFKSALGRGGTVEDIVCQDIRMTGIQEEAIIMTMSYALNSLTREEQKPADVQEEDIPYFRQITCRRIICLGCGRAVRIEPLGFRPETISQVTITDSFFTAEKENKIAGQDIRVE